MADIPPGPWLLEMLRQAMGPDPGSPVSSLNEDERETALRFVAYVMAGGNSPEAMRARMAMAAEQRRAGRTWDDILSAPEVDRILEAGGG
jgi:hypothetical protein